MAEGGLQSVINLLVRTDTEGESKLDRLKKKLENLGSGAQDGAEEATGFMDSFRDALGMAGDEAEETESSFMKLTGQGLALLFAGRFLSKTFGGMARNMRDMVGISDMLDGAMKSVLAPAFTALVGPVSRLTEWFMELDENTKMLIGSAVIFLSVAAPLLSVFGQLVAMAAAFNLSLVAIAATIAPVVAAVTGFIAVAWAAHTVVEELGSTFGMVLLVLATLVAAFAAAPVVVVSALAVMAGAAWAMRDDIVAAVQTIIEWLSKIVSKARELGSQMASAGKEMGRNFVDGLVNFLRQNSGRVLDALDTLTPGIPLRTLLDAGGSMAGAAMSRVNDFVITDSGRMLKTHPNDTIIGTKNPDSLGGGNGNTVNIRVDNPTVRDDRDIDKIAREIEKRMDRNTRGRGLTR